MTNTSSSGKAFNLRREIPAYAAVWLVALAARLVYLWQIRHAPVFTLFLGDGVSYDAWARQIAHGDWFGRGVFYQAPLYPYFLGLVYTLFGTNLWVVRVIQIAIGATSCVLLALAGRSFFSRTTGLLAALILAFYPTAIFFDCSIQKSVLDLFFLCALLAVMGRLSGRTEPVWWAVAGIVLGLLALTRENALIFFPILLVWLFVGWRHEFLRTRLRWAGLLTIGLGVVLLPVAGRNLAVGGEFHLTTAQFGPNFYMGNGKGATGLYRALRWGRGSAKTERDDATTLAEQSARRTLTPSEVSRYWTAKALAEIRDDPVGWLRLMVKKWWLVWNVSEVGDSEDQYTSGDWSSLLHVLNQILHFGTLCPLAALGICLTWRQRERVWLLYMMLVSYAVSVTLFYVFSRYRFPLAPMLILFVAAGLTGLRAAVQEARWREVLTGMVAALVAALACNGAMVSESDIRASTEYNIADGLLTQESNPSEAIPHYEKAVRLLPEFALARVELGVVLARVGRTQEAINEYRLALQSRPDYPEAHNNLGAALADEGKTNEAIAHIREALRLNPDHTEAHRNLAVLFARQGRIDEAIAQVQGALKLEPDSKESQQALDKLQKAKDAGKSD